MKGLATLGLSFGLIAGTSGNAMGQDIDPVHGKFEGWKSNAIATCHATNNALEEAGSHIEFLCDKPANIVKAQGNTTFIGLEFFRAHGGNIPLQMYYMKQTRMPSGHISRGEFQASPDDYLYSFTANPISPYSDMVNKILGTN